MVVMRTALADDSERINEFLAKHHLLSFTEAYSEKEFMLAEEKGQIIGISVFRRLSGGFAAIEGIHIISSERGMGLGDGLLRATLNYLCIQALDKAILLADKSLADFYLHEGLIQLSQSDGHLTSIFEASYSEEVLRNCFYCSIGEFFSRKCKGSKGV